jgi:hypothetical protein
MRSGNISPIYSISENPPKFDAEFPWIFRAGHTSLAAQQKFYSNGVYTYTRLLHLGLHFTFRTDI